MRRLQPEWVCGEWGVTKGAGSERCTDFLAGAVLCRFHSLRVWSSEAVTSSGSTGWKARLRTESKWLRRVNLGFQLFLSASVLLVI